MGIDDQRTAVLVAREHDGWRIAAVKDGEPIKPDGPVDAREAAEVVAEVLPEIAQQARGAARSRALRQVTPLCPLGRRCESCGADARDVRIVVLPVLNAAMCLTMCGSCATSGRPPSVMLSTAEKLADQHRRHVDVHRTSD